MMKGRIKMTTCENCGASVQEGTKFCKACGHSLASMPQLVCEGCGAPVQAGSKVCSACGYQFKGSLQPVCKNCGAPIQEGTKFCKSCGHQIQSTTPSVPTCRKCGAKLKEGVRFCEKCGLPVGGAEGPADYYEMPPTPQPLTPPAKKSNTGLIAALISLIVVLVIAIGVGLWLINNDDEDDRDRDSKPKQTESARAEETEKPEEPEEVEVTKAEKVEETMGAFLKNNGLENNVSVAVFDNATGERYTTDRTTDIYTAWGLYLPIYLAYGETDYYDLDIRDEILSSDPATCNASANAAIGDLGGFHELNNMLGTYYGSSATTYGRLFGDTKASSDNYTTANDAVLFLDELNEKGEYGKLSYDMRSFGITAPADASVYALIGSENRNVRNQLNLFAIVKGNNSDYCVAILTRNSSGGYISNLLATIHAEMEA